MTNYNAVFKTLRRETGYDHIDPFPRSDLQSAYIFVSPTISTDQLRKNLERRIRVTPKIDPTIAEMCMLYVLPTNLPESFPEDIREGYKGLHPHAVFIRGATNHFLLRDAQAEAGKLLLSTFKKLEQKYGEDNMGWRFKEAKLLLNTRTILKEHDLELAKREFQLENGIFLDTV